MIQLESSVHVHLLLTTNLLQYDFVADFGCGSDFEGWPKMHRLIVYQNRCSFREQTRYVQFELLCRVAITIWNLPNGQSIQISFILRTILTTHVQYTQHNQIKLHHGNYATQNVLCAMVCTLTMSTVAPWQGTNWSNEFLGQSPHSCIRDDFAPAAVVVYANGILLR